MTEINRFMLFNSHRIKCLFVDAIGNSKNITGTGFFIEARDGLFVFVTNKHNVDATLKLGNATGFELSSIEIELRKRGAGINGWLAETRFFEVGLNIVKHAEADVALIIPNFGDAIGLGFNFKGLKKTDLADQHFFLNSIKPFDKASFIGYAGKGESQWWDTEWNLAIARNIEISSLPELPITNPAIKTSDVILVSGLSFSGSSGGLVISHAKGIGGTRGLGNQPHVPPRIIGIMSGHWWEEGNVPEMFLHSGLSYVTRSVSILELINNLPDPP